MERAASNAKRRARYAAVTVLLMLIAAACVPNPPVVPPGNISGGVRPPGFNHSPPVSLNNVSYGNRIDPCTDEAYQELDVYRPSVPRAEQHGVILFLHSGGWVSGSKEYKDGKSGDSNAWAWVAQGWSVVSVDYALSCFDNGWKNSHPQALQDVKRAIRYIKANQSSLGINTSENLFLWGTSAGGHLAALAGMTAGQFEPTGLPSNLAAQNSKVDAVITRSGPLNFVSWKAHCQADADCNQFLPDNNAMLSFMGAYLGCGSTASNANLDKCLPAAKTQASVSTHYDANDPRSTWRWGRRTGGFPRRRRTP
ncbi:MAG: alpha/beta hydrolase [Acidimicrobiia bacterium]|nr:alpha/beta hydrolase [Acidimicrobiia bacterium]